MATREENLKKINEQLEKLSDEELEKVAGGTIRETELDGYELVKRGFLSFYDIIGEGLKVETFPPLVSEKLREFGYTGYKANKNEANIYTDKNGNKISRETFWANFDAENGTQIS